MGLLDGFVTGREDSSLELLMLSPNKARPPSKKLEKDKPYTKSRDIESMKRRFPKKTALP